MSTASCSSELLATDTADHAPTEGRPMLGLTLGVLISVPLWAGLWCASAWI